MTAKAYAYVDTFNHISVSTISETPQAAMVNALAEIELVMVTVDWTPELITEVFNERLSASGSVQPVHVLLKGEMH